jgi:hypothetical protein
MPATPQAQLSYDVFVSDGPVKAGEQRLPNGVPLVWNPLASTLMIQLYPDRLNPGPVWYGALGLLGG